MPVRSHKEAALEFLTLVASGKVREAYQKHVSEGFRHHNPVFPGTAAALMDAMEQNAVKNPNKVLDIKTTLQEGNRVAVFSHVRQNPKDRGGAVVHLFRFENDRIVEFWDIGQAIPEQSVNENGMF